MQDAFEEYVNKLSEMGTPCGALELHAWSEIVGAPIWVCIPNEDPAVWNCWGRGGAIWLWYNKGHYQLLEGRPDGVVSMIPTEAPTKGLRGAGHPARSESSWGGQTRSSHMARSVGVKDRPDDAVNAPTK